MFALLENYNIMFTYFRAVVKPDTGDIVGQCLILDPISFALNLSRNHSCSWHTDQPEIHISGKLAAVQVRKLLLFN